jgi:hypothetical protein
MWLITMSVGGDHLVTGTWLDLERPGYHGAWMGKINLTGDYITGWYLGPSERGPCGAGEWIWWRDGTSAPMPPEPLLQAAPRTTSRS